MNFMERFDEKYMPEPMSGCFLWTASVGEKGYGVFWTGRKTTGAHIASYLIHVGEVPDGLRVLHRCDVRCCVNPKHLFLGTDKDNTQDMIKKGRADYSRALRGEHHAMSTLTASQVLRIRSDSRPTTQIATEYDISTTHVRRIKRGANWGHL